jgi:putative RNA 2'-phosphotransferase
MLETSTNNKAIDKTRMLRTLSYALRHEPWKFGLDLNAEGFTCLDGLIQSLCKRLKEYREKAPEILMETICELDSERFEVCGRRIRARYGHSFPVRRIGTSEFPPEFLYHGTSNNKSVTISRVGLQPMDRFFVHLTSNVEYAASVGIAKGEACILQVRARLAHEAGMLFYRANSHVWLTNEIPIGYLSENVMVPDNTGVPSPIDLC